MTPYSEPLPSPQARPAVSPSASLQSEKLRDANIFAPVLIGLALFWLLVPLLTVDNPSTGMSLAAATASGAIGLTVCLEMMVRANILTRGLMLFGVTVYFARILVGVLHYVLLFDPNYFSTHMPVFQYLPDFEALGNAASYVSSSWDIYGFGPVPPDLFDTKNAYLFPYFGLLYYLGGNEHFLNFSVLNSLHACFVAILVTRFANGLWGKITARTVFVIAMLQPFGFIASVQWRDSVGQFFLITGALLAILAPLNIRSMPSIVVGALSMMTLRNLYFINALIAFGAKISALRKTSVLSLVAGLILTAVLLVLVYLYSQSILVYQLNNDAFIFNQGPSRAAYQLFRNITGPFPWTQGFDPLVAGHELMFEAVLQSCFSLAIIYMAITSFRKPTIDLSDPVCRATFAFVAAVMAMGALSYGHTTYMTVASVLLLPYIYALSVKRFLKVFSSFLAIVMVAGLLWAWLGFGAGAEAASF